MGDGRNVLRPFFGRSSCSLESEENDIMKKNIKLQYFPADVPKSPNENTECTSPTLDSSSNLTPSDSYSSIDEDCNNSIDSLLHLNLGSDDLSDISSLDVVEDEKDDNAKDSSRITTNHDKPMHPEGASTCVPSLGDDLMNEMFDTTETFVLLVHPKVRIFEVMLLSYPSVRTIIGDLLEMIPSNATEPILGSQLYEGFFTIRNGVELLDKNAKCISAVETGDMLVAIPRGYSSHTIHKFSTQILNNARVNKLLRKFDPVKNKDQPPVELLQVSKNKRPSKRSSKRASRRASNILKLMQEVKQDTDLDITSVTESSSFDESMSTLDVEELASLSKSKDLICSPEVIGVDDIVEASISSWNTSFERSFSAPRTELVKHRRREEWNRLIHSVGKSAFILMSYSIMHYMCSSDGYAVRSTREINQSLGLGGFLQFICIGALFMSIQMTQGSKGKRKVYVI